MRVGELLHRVDEYGVTLHCEWTTDRLHYAPAKALPPDLVSELKEHKAEVIRILREDEEYRRTGIIQCERQAFDLSQDYFGENSIA